MPPQPLTLRVLHGVCLALPWLTTGWLAGEPLETFLPDEETVRRLQPTLEQLESESFAEREEASRTLAALPALPGFIRALARTETRAESRIRLRELAAAFPLEKENDRLTAALREIAANHLKGQLDPMQRVMAAGVWTPATDAWHDAARATATPDDVPRITGWLNQRSIPLRRLATAALAGLPPAESADLLAVLIDDADDTVALLAALELAGRKDPRALAAMARLLESEDFQIRYRCHAVLQGLTQQDFGYDPAAEARDRKPSAARWREWTTSPEAALTGEVPKDMSVVLFNGRNLHGWEIRAAGEPLAAADDECWKAVDGELHCNGKNMVASGDLWTQQRFQNFVLTLEYRAAANHSDSGVGLLLTKDNERGPQGPKYLEVQLLPGKAGDIYQIGGCAIEADNRPLRFQLQRRAKVEDPAGQWHKLKLTVRNGAVAVDLNGVAVNRTSKGPQGPGRVVLRNEGTPLAFRNLLLQPLPSQ